MRLLKFVLKVIAYLLSAAAATVVVFGWGLFALLFISESIAPEYQSVSFLGAAIVFGAIWVLSLVWVYKAVNGQANYLGWGMVWTGQWQFALLFGLAMLLVWLGYKFDWIGN